MQIIFSYIRKIIILLIGVPIVIVGVILVPLPGPGFLVIFVGLLVLSYEFEWARKYRDSAQKKVTELFNQSKARADRMSKK